MNKPIDTVWHPTTITRSHREKRNGHPGAVLWFTGLSGAGKSTLAHAVEEELFRLGCQTFVLDGDNVRQGLCSDLGFSIEDRSENIRRIGESAKLFVDAGLIVMAAFISPLRADRQRTRDLFPPGNFIEIHCRASLEICESRDVKGMYRRAKAGEIKEFTGISSPYEAPENPELTIDTGSRPLASCVADVTGFLRLRGIVPAMGKEGNQVGNLSRTDS